MNDPNGFGTVYKRTDKKRRRPWAVRVLNGSGKGYQTLAHVKAMLSNMYKFAIENDIRCFLFVCTFS